MTYVAKYEGMLKDPDVKRWFENQMKTLVRSHIQLPGGGTISLDWRSGSISALSNKVGRSLITKQLSDILVRADSPEDVPE